MQRRTFLRTSGLGLLALAAPAAEPAEAASVADAFDAEMEAFMKPRGVPGGALAVVKNRRLVYAKGYGWADRDAKLPVVPESLFRIASISKPFTAVAVSAPPNVPVPLALLAVTTSDAPLPLVTTSPA